MPPRLLPALILIAIGLLFLASNLGFIKGSIGSVFRIKAGNRLARMGIPLCRAMPMSVQAGQTGINRAAPVFQGYQMKMNLPLLLSRLRHQEKIKR